MMPCKGCGFRHQCVCDEFPRLRSDVQIALLCHPNEMNRATNTGKLLLRSLKQAQQFVWDRKSPPEELLNLIDTHPNPVLLFPSADSQALQQKEESHGIPPLYIVLDATWQEARKMWRQSPWLQKLPQVHLDITAASGYSLRRNQDAGNICTYEVGIELVKAHQGAGEARRMREFLQHYLRVYQADKSGHKLNKVQ